MATAQKRLMKGLIIVTKLPVRKDHSPGGLKAADRQVAGGLRCRVTEVVEVQCAKEDCQAGKGGNSLIKW